MTVDPTPSVRPGRPARRAVRHVAMAIAVSIPIAACSSGTTDEPTAASTQEPTDSTAPPPTAIPGETTTVANEPRTGTGSFGDVPVTFTQPAGWDNIGWGVIKGDPIFGLLFMEVGNTYTDSCPSIQRDPPVGPTVEDLASAWADLPALNATAPTDITVDGFEGKQVEFTVPDYATGEAEDDCANGGHFMVLGGSPDPSDGYWAQGPNAHQQLWILDVDGTRVVIGAHWFPDTSAQDRADIDEMLSSIQIG
jgi:hypothetical protein